MLYQKNDLGKKYTQLLTGSPWFFITYILIGIMLFLFLTLTTRVEVIKSYLVEISHDQSQIVLLIKYSKVSANKGYIYSNKNEAIYPVAIKRVEDIRGAVALYLDNEGQELINSLSAQDIYIDLPVENETLLYRIFMKGGKDRG